MNFFISSITTSLSESKNFLKCSAFSLAALAASPKASEQKSMPERNENNYTGLTFGLRDCREVHVSLNVLGTILSSLNCFSLIYSVFVTIIKTSVQKTFSRVDLASACTHSESVVRAVRVELYIRICFAGWVLLIG